MTRGRTAFVLPTAACLTFLLGFETGGFQVSILKIAGEFGANGTMMGVIIAFQYIAILAAPLVFGRAADHVGKKKILAIFMPVFAVGCVSAGFCSSLSQFIAGVFLIGTGYSVCECTITAAIVDTFPDKSERYINLTQSAFGFGAVVSPLLMKFLMDLGVVTWRFSFFLSATGMLALVPVLLLADVKPVSHFDFEAKTPQPKARSMLLISLVLCMLFYVGIENGAAYFADAIFTLHLHAASYGAYAISLYWLSMAIARLVLGKFRCIPKYSVPISMGFAAVIFVGIMFSKGVFLSICLYSAAGFACGSVWAGITETAAKLYPGATGTVMGYLTAGAGLGGAVSPVLMGAFMDAFGSSTAFIILVLLAAATGSIMLWVKKTNYSNRR